MEMLYIKCGCCGQTKHESAFWNVYTSNNKRQELDELAPHTKVVMKARENKQRNCKECADNWWKLNKHRRENYNLKYRKKLSEKGVKRLYELKELEVGT